MCFYNRDVKVSTNSLVDSTYQGRNNLAFPWTASLVFHFRFYQRTSTLLWSGDTAYCRMSRQLCSVEQSVRAERYQGTLHDGLDKQSSLYLFQK